MGDRAALYVMNAPDRGVYLYTHWTGSTLPEITRAALARRERWDDPAYLTRIVFSAMIREDIDAATGYGISATPVGVEYPIIVLDCDQQRIGLSSWRHVFENTETDPPTVERWRSFEEYIANAPAQWPATDWPPVRTPRKRHTPAATLPFPKDTP